MKPESSLKPIAEKLVQISPDQQAKFTDAHEKSTNTFNYIITLFDQLEAEDQDTLIEFYDHTNKLAEKFETLFDEVSKVESASIPQSELNEMLLTAETLCERLESVKTEIMTKMEKLGYEITVKIADESPEKKKEIGSPSESKETHYLADDVERLKQGDPGILYQNGEKKQGFKDLEELRLDIKAIFEAAGRNDEFDNFYKTKFKANAHLIHTNTELYVKANPTDRNNILIALKKYYEQILNNASEWLKKEIVQPESDSAEVTIASVEEDESKRHPRFKSSDPNQLSDQHVKDYLVKELFSQNYDFLYADVAEDGKKKKKRIQDLKSDIQAVFEARKVSPERVKNFFDIQFKIQHDEIDHFVYLLKTEKDKNKIREYRDGIDAAYEQIRNDAIAEVMMAKSAYNEELKNIDRGSSLVQRDVESIKGDIDTARIYLDALKARHENTEGFITSAEYKKVESLFELINNCEDPDSNILNHKLEKYLTGLWPALDELTHKFTVGTGAESVEPKLDKEDVAVPETADQGLGVDKEAILKEFEELQNIPNDSPLRDSEEFQRAVRGYEVVQEYKNHVQPAVREKVFDIFARHVEALQKKIKELEAEPAAASAAKESGAAQTLDADLEQQQVQEFLNGVEVTELDEIPKVTESANLIDPAHMAERKEQGKNSLEAKNVFRRTEKKYKEALEIHQQEMNNQGMFAKMRSLGMKPELPESLKALEAEYQALRKVYARELDARLSQRGEKYELSQDDMKRAFARKFILKPHEELLKLQEYNLLKPEARARLQSIAGKMAKHKWGIRAGVITLAGVVGFATGGTALAFAGAAGERGARMLGSAVFGAYAGGIAHDRAEEYVEQKRNELENTKSSISKNFSIDTMFDSAGNLVKATEAEAKARKIQKVAGVVAGGIAGFAAGYGSGLGESAIDRYDAELRNGSGGVTPPVPGALSEGDLSKLETSKIVPQVVESVDVSPQPAFIKEVALPFDSREGGLVYEHHVNDISFGSEFKPAALTDADTKALNSFIRVKLDDILAPNPNTPVPEIEQRLQAAIEKSFGDSQWWKDSPIKSVDIGKVEVVLMSGTEIAPEIVKGEYIVQKGDTLWDVAEEKFAGQLKDLTPQERNEVLGRLFERVKADSGLMESLSLDSVNNIDLIKTGESIELDGLQAELTQVLEDREIVEEFRKSAPLTVEADSDVKSVPISVVEKPIPTGGTEVVINNERSYTEAPPTKPVITAETTTSTKGFYETAPQHVRDEIRQYFNNPKDFHRAVNVAAYKIDARAYDFFDTLSNTYKSPYEFLSGKTLAEFSELETKPNAELREILAKQNIKYEAFLEWGDKIKELEKNIPHTKTDTISTMFEQSVFQDKVTEQDRVM